MRLAHTLLLAPTPQSWIDRALQRALDVLLVDHANCEKKAASTALALMFAYAEDLELAEQMSRLAREELRHYEQVAQLLRTLGDRAARGWRRVAMRSVCGGWSRAPSPSARSIS